jgi:hypothetical protein
MVMLERRKRRRFPVQQPVFLKGQEKTGFSEIRGVSENDSENGLLLLTSQRIRGIERCLAVRRKGIKGGAEPHLAQRESSALPTLRAILGRSSWVSAMSVEHTRYCCYLLASFVRLLSSVST